MLERPPRVPAWPQNKTTRPKTNQIRRRAECRRRLIGAGSHRSKGRAKIIGLVVKVETETEAAAAAGGASLAAAANQKPETRNQVGWAGLGPRPCRNGRLTQRRQLSGRPPFIRRADLAGPKASSNRRLNRATGRLWPGPADRLQRAGVRVN